MKKMKLGLYNKLALTNIKNHRRLFVPFMLASLCMAAMFYIMLFLVTNDGLMSMRGAESICLSLILGAIVIGIFSVIILLYANSFLMKRRKNEIGLYNILGMEKRHIARIMALETLYTGLVSIICGIACGILFSKLLMLLLCAILFFEIPFGFTVSLPAVLLTLLLFSVIFFIALLTNIASVHLSKPIELLRGGRVGEKEPKTRHLLTIFGTLTLGGAYALAVLIKTPTLALLVFFFAVILVIIGTYFLFTGGSISVLKLLRRNKKYYYNPKHFTAISGMLYRMKQNAGGLASICILSTMVLVMISSSACLYFGVEDIQKLRHPRDLEVVAYELTDNEYEALRSAVDDAFAQKQLTNPLIYRFRQYSFYLNGSEFMEPTPETGDASSNSDIHVIPLSDFNSSHELSETLLEDEVLVYSPNATFNLSSITLLGKEYSVKSVLTSTKIVAPPSVLGEARYYIVMRDMTALIDRDMSEYIKSDTEYPGYYSLYYGMDSTGSHEYTEAVYEQLSESVDAYREKVGHNNVTVFVDCIETSRVAMFSVMGGLFFLGIFLGLIFIMATVLIMYYKQISEGYEDRERYVIMRKVGMSHREVRASIRTQVLTVFFLPLITAGIHVAFAFPLICKLFLLIGLTNTGLFIFCTLLSYLLFALLYLVVYLLTARTYYKIVA